MSQPAGPVVTEPGLVTDPGAEASAWPGSRWRRAAHHLLDYLDLRPGRALMVYERPYAEVARNLGLAAQERATPIDFAAVESFTPRELELRLNDAEKFLCAFNRTYATGLSPLVDVMVGCGTENAERAYTLSDLSGAFVDVFQADPRQLAVRNARLIRALQAGRTLVVRDDRGTDLTVTFDPQYEWVNQDGYTEAGYALTMNLPMGEVATYTPLVEGTLMFTGGLLGTIPIGRKYGPIADVLELTIEQGRLATATGANPELMADLRYCLDYDDYTSQVNEIGFGTNPAIRGPVTGFNYKHEESRLGFHLGFGASLAQQNVTRLTPHHLDLLLDDCRMYLDDRLIFDGDYRFDDFPAADAPEPLRLTSRSCCMPANGAAPGWCQTE